MNKKQKNEMLEVFAEGFHEVVVPILEDIQNKMATKEDIRELKMDIESLDRKFEAQQVRLDRHGKDIETLKSHFVTT